ncbi:hypothetical protein C1Y40_05776 [Mycobacterium talmoniae]|uniref:Uncharacterized protein n=1 Tax=Mycobacterium talmoniae TaxID=1858794 RepID=A0A2S8BBP2_9MYCO|nr:hypothetical protein C1Y40_05776 [Mycobacterium talmoniae]
MRYPAISDPTASMRYRGDGDGRRAVIGQIYRRQPMLVGRLGPSQAVTRNGSVSVRLRWSSRPAF